MKRLSYIMGVFFVSFSGLAAVGDRTGHTVTIVVRHVDKISVTNRTNEGGMRADVHKESGNINRIAWSSTRLGKKITVRVCNADDSMRKNLYVMQCSGCSVALLPRNPTGCRDLVLDTRKSGECVVSVRYEPPEAGKSINDVMYTMMDTY